MENHDHFFENDTTNSTPPVMPAVKNAAYFRARAREVLKGKWKIAVVLCLLASILGGVIGGGLTFNFSTEDSKEVETVLESVDWEAETLAPIVLEYDADLLIVFAIVAVFAVLTSLAVPIFVSSPIKTGYQRVNLDLVDGKDVEVKHLFAFFQRGYWRSVKLNLLQFLILGLPILLPALGVAWFSFDFLFDVAIEEQIVLTIRQSFSTTKLLLLLACVLLLTVAAVFCVVLGYAYRFAFMILGEYPDTRASDALRMSRNMMRGHKLRLFCLEFSFIGWTLLAMIFTFGIGMLWVIPYREAAIAAFYDDLANRSAAKVTEFPSLDFDDYQTDEPEAKEEEPITTDDLFEEDEEEQTTQAPRIDPDSSMPFTNEVFFPSLDLEDSGEEDFLPMKKRKQDDKKDGEEH